MKTRVIVLSSPDHADHIVDVVRQESKAIQIEVAYTVDDLLHSTAVTSENSLLISYATSVIVPRDILKRFNGNAVNFHAAPPEYPGRDPHHFAHYDEVKRYGATAHMMTPKVDDGPILAVEFCDVPAESRPVDLMMMANAAACRLMKKVVPGLLRGELPKPLDLAWSRKKRSRADFLKLCRLPRYADENEVTKRSGSVEYEGRANLFMDIHGFRFRLEGRIPEDEIATKAVKWREFTEAAYSNLLDRVRDRFQFIEFDENLGPGRVLWCHHTHMSVHRAKRLAEIERQKGLSSTYFLMLGSAFYDLNELSVLHCARSIVGLGHRIGLLFDLNRYEQANGAAGWKNAVAAERASLMRLLEADVGVVSFDGLLPLSNVPHDTIVAGMANSSSKSFRARHRNYSDDTGRWHGEGIADLCDLSSQEPAQVVIHPEWWTPEALSPQERVERCVAGRAAAAMRVYSPEID